MLVATYAGASQRIFSAGRRKAAGPPARSAKGQKVYGDLPGLLARAGPMPASGGQAGVTPLTAGLQLIVVPIDST
jgi:hypothetical protein